MADYAKKTNADLVELLKARSLPHTGKKAEMVARLQEDDAKNDGKPEGATAGETTAAAGGEGTVPNPVAVPNQKLDEDPAKTDDLKVEATGAVGANGTGEAAGEAAAAAEEKPAVNFAQGLPVTEFEEEVKKRKARAAKFGTTDETDAAIADAEKQLERAKRFGTGVESNSANVGVKGLDEALSSERKRGRGDLDGGRGGKRRNFGGRINPRQRGRVQKTGGSESAAPKWNEQDTAAMEARKKRFG